MKNYSQQQPDTHYEIIDGAYVVDADILCRSCNKPILHGDLCLSCRLAAERRLKHKAILDTWQQNAE